MTTTSQINDTIRGLRAPELRDLARLAVRDDWDLYTRPGGHIDVVNPINGAVVRLSSTAYAGPQTIRSKRHEFQQAGLDLRSKAERRREKRIVRASLNGRAPIVPPLQVEASSSEVSPMVQQNLPVEEHRPPAPGKGEAHARYRDGRTVFISDEIAVIGDARVRIRQQAGGALVAWSPPEADIYNRKAWSVSPKGSPGGQSGGGRARTLDEQRALLEAKVRDWIADGKPERKHQPSRPANERSVETREKVVGKGNGLAEVEVGVGAVLAEPPTAAQERRSAIWTTARVDPSDYPIAVALDELERAVEPAVAALEAAGKTDAANLVRSELTKTPAEAELLALWRELTTKPHLEHE